MNTSGASLFWDHHGGLPPGEHPMTLAELGRSFLVTGGQNPPVGWDMPRRSLQVANLCHLAGHLYQVGIDEIFIDGSFSTTKPSPGDIDAYFITDLLLWKSQLQKLRALDASWTYDPADRKPTPDGKRKWPQWFQYQIEFFYVFRPPHHHSSFMGTTNPPVTIDQFFRSDAGGNPRGLIRLVR
jgi:hypothetical protein